MNSKVSVDNQIRNVLERVDQEGRLITIFLVGLGIILVIYQAIRWMVFWNRSESYEFKTIIFYKHRLSIQLNNIIKTDLN